MHAVLVWAIKVAAAPPRKQPLPLMCCGIILGGAASSLVHPHDEGAVASFLVHPHDEGAVASFLVHPHDEGAAASSRALEQLGGRLLAESLRPGT